MLRQTRSNKVTSPLKESSGTKRKNIEDLENLPSPPSSPRRKITKSVLPETPKNIRNITKELQLAQLKSPSNSSIYLKTKSTNEKENLYQKAKTVFRRTAIPSRLIGRENERTQMMDFWKTHVLQNQAGCLYISGMPGTGKTAMLTEVMRLVEDDVMALRTHTVKTVVVNCMSVKEPKQIYTKLVEELRPTAKTPIQSDVVKQAEELINTKKNVLNVVILDEIDSLITKDQDVLYKIFEWASLPTSQLVLIGIANALDLTDRILPRLRAKNCEPQLLNFNPYQVSEISSIIKDRLFSLVEDPQNPFGPAPKPTQGTAPPLIMPMAIEFCARKVASSMGDLRTALDVCRQAIELAEMDYKKKLNSTSVLSEQKSNASSAVPPVPIVTVAHVSRVLNIVFGNSNLQKLKELNLQQKIVLGVILVMIRSSTTKANKKDILTVGKFREQYSALCSDKSTAISAVSRTELSDLLSLLETQSILTLGKSKEDRTRKIQLNVQESEIIQMINSMPFLKDWMDGVIEKSGF
ncbi:hypothetical protein HPULCUR_001778 [Helicostylum pulchrum]|uniref:Cell division control protein n=1 Tax=Helicostylum pulchrum TaxID=562976 RepID=A0ABP9XNS4_9FUNG